MDEKGRMDVKERIEEAVSPLVGTLMTSGNARVLIKHITTLVSNLTVPREVYEKLSKQLAAYHHGFAAISFHGKELERELERLSCE